MLDQERLENILSVLLEYTQKDFSRTIPITEKGDEIDAIALGVNVIGDELGHYIEELRAAQERLNSFMDSSNLLFILFDQEMKVTEINKTAVHLLKKESKEECLGKTIKETLPGITIEKQEKYLNVLKTGKRISFIDKVEHPDFGVKFLEISAFKVNQGVGFILNDVTEKIAAETRFEKLMESAPDALVIINETGKIELINKQTEILFGFKRQELIGKPVEILIPGRYGLKHVQHRSDYFKRPKMREMGVGMELSGKRKDGSEFPVEISLSPIELPAGILVSAAIRDVTERKKAENIIRDTKEQLEKIIQNAPNAVVIIDEESYIIEWNPKAEILFGWKKEEVLGKSMPAIIMPSKYRDRHFEGIRHFLNTGVGPVLNNSIELSAMRKGQIEFPIEISISSVKRKDKVIFIAFITDITERKKAENLIKSFNEELQSKNEELQMQQEELRKANEELEEQTVRLEEQQEELEASNEELEEQKDEIDKKNKILEKNQVALEEKTKQLTLSSKYKSEFLANMSHELRSPLNSMLILSEDLAENKDGNLTEEQVQSARIINQSGEDLLSLINDILDFSKIEAGKMDINIQHFKVSEIAEKIKNTFLPIAKEKGIGLHVYLDYNAPDMIQSDLQRVNQIVKNLVSNAVKFTEKGEVNVKINLSDTDNKYLVITVSDTGIGIDPAKQKLIFEAFQQGEGSTSRKYGGTGLGLSIATQLSKLLAGEISLQSEVGKGSSFELKLPVKPLVSLVEEKTALSGGTTITDDRAKISDEDITLLIIDNEEAFAAALKKQAEQKKFKSIIATSAEEGLKLLDEFSPDAIIVNVGLPGINEESFLQQIKNKTESRKTPVHIVASHEKAFSSMKESSIIQYLIKPVKKKDLEKAFDNIALNINKGTKHLLIVEDDPATRTALKKLMSGEKVIITEAATVKKAIEILEKEKIDCVILDLILKNRTGFEIIDHFQKKEGFILPPVIVYTSKNLSEEEVAKMSQWAESIIVKSEKSQERLLDEATLFLHKAYSKLQSGNKSQRESHYDKEEAFKGKRVLIVDDDMRNVFALSKVLNDKGLEVLKAENGIKAVQMVKDNPDLDLVLMDIMMPEMDGYEAMRRIREDLKLKDLPIIALTAKAMKDDREKCINAGANDYFSKPIQIDKLLTLMRVWIK